MKLLMCTECGQVFSLTADMEPCSCKCGKTTGRWVGDMHAVASGPCELLGLSARGLAAMAMQPCGTFKRVETVTDG